MTKSLPLKFLSLLAFALSAATADKDFMLSPPPAAYSYDAPDLRAEGSGLDTQDPLEALASSIPGGGVPGQDYPILAVVPRTGFSCATQQFPGYYADTAAETACQVFHICQTNDHQDSFLCPNGTVFSQQYFVCDWWYSVDCTASDKYFARNAEIGAVMAETAAASLRSDTVAQSQTYAAPQDRQSSPASPQQYGAPQQRQATPAPAQQYGAPQERQVTPSPVQQYGTPQERLTVPAPAQRYGAPQGRQSAPTPPQLYDTTQQRQSIASPSRFYSFPNRL